MHSMHLVRNKSSVKSRNTKNAANVESIHCCPDGRLVIDSDFPVVFHISVSYRNLFLFSDFEFMIARFSKSVNNIVWKILIFQYFIENFTFGDAESGIYYKRTEDTIRSVMRKLKNSTKGMQVMQKIR
jgi:hypothetical protein